MNLLPAMCTALPVSQQHPSVSLNAAHPEYPQAAGQVMALPNHVEKSGMGAWKPRLNHSRVSRGASGIRACACLARGER